MVRAISADGEDEAQAAREIISLALMLDRFVAMVIWRPSEDIMMPTELPCWAQEALHVSQNGSSGLW